jgi:hypothetical protein
MSLRDFSIAAAYFVGALLVIREFWLGISRRPAPPERISLFWGVLLLALVALCAFLIQPS